MQQPWVPAVRSSLPTHGGHTSEPCSAPNRDIGSEAQENSTGHHWDKQLTTRTAQDEPLPLQCSATPETTLPLQSVSTTPHGASPGFANSASPTPSVWLTHVSIAAVDTASSTAFARMGNTRGSMSGRIVGIGRTGGGALAGAAGSGWRPGIWLTTPAQPRALRPPLAVLELRGLYHSDCVCLFVFDTRWALHSSIGATLRNERQHLHQLAGTRIDNQLLFSHSASNCGICFPGLDFERCSDYSRDTGCS